MQNKVLCPPSTVFVRMQDGQDRCDNGTLKNTETKSAYNFPDIFKIPIHPLKSKCMKKITQIANHASHCSLGHTFGLF